MTKYSIVLILLIAGIVIVNSQLPATTEVKAAKNADYGDYLTDGNGVTLYMFELDSYNTSNCYGTCATVWPPYTLASGVTPTAGTGATSGLLGTTKRTDGTFIVTYNGWPLYYYKGEVGVPNSVKCQAIKESGGLWLIVNPNGKVNFTTKGRPNNTASKNTLEVASSTSFGQYITDKDGVVLYTFEKDIFNTSKCYSTCATDWPPYTIPTTSFPTFGTGVEGSAVYYTTRTDGTRQITFNGWPLYYYKDEKVGGTQKCQNENMNGGFWWIIKPNGDVNKTPKPSMSSSNFMQIGVISLLSLLALLL